MMSKTQALAYGRRIGCKFYVRNSNGGLLGGFTTRKDRLNRNLKVYIEEV